MYDKIHYNIKKKKRNSKLRENSNNDSCKERKKTEPQQRWGKQLDNLQDAGGVYSKVAY